MGAVVFESVDGGLFGTMKRTLNGRIVIYFCLRRLAKTVSALRVLELSPKSN